MASNCFPATWSLANDNTAMTSPNPPQRANPYQAPTSVDDGIEFIEIPVPGASDRLTERTLAALSGTLPWVRLIGWLAILVGCFAGLNSIAGGMRLAREGLSSVWPAMMSVLLAVVYATGGILLLRYGSRIVDFTISRRVEHLDSALEAQRAFWRFLGVSIAASFILLLGTILLVFWGAGAAALWEKFFQ